MATDITDLYRCFDANDELLYVGVSINAVRRIEDHRSSKSWYGEIKTVTIENLPTRLEALQAETKAINEESPKYQFIK